MAFKLLSQSVFIIFLIPCYIWGEMPWGKDAELIKPLSSPCTDWGEMAGFEAIILFHHQVVTHADGPRSHFIPSSSQYMLNSIRKYGFLKGFPYGCDRLIRENNDPWVYSVVKTRDGHYLKSDPVP